MTLGVFPFGQPVLDLVQTDLTLKKVFVLGVYSSAVHARWMSITGKTIVNALAVASEPEIFWRGENAESIISKIKIPKELGLLVPARRDFNGPSGIALDNLILNPLGLERNEAWLCDLVPHSCVNPSQSKAIARAYLGIAANYGLPEPTVPLLPITLTDDVRRNSILSEIVKSEAKTIILLGDLPIRWFLSFFDHHWAKLSDFCVKGDGYGFLHDTQVGEMKIAVLPIAHPRQIAKLGSSNKYWYETHSSWIQNTSSEIAKQIID